MRTIISKPRRLGRVSLIKHCFFLVLTACYLTSFAKDPVDKTHVTTPPFAFTVSGKVVDAQGNGLSGASITEKGTTNATTTAANGNFTIIVQGQSATLVFTYVSYQTKEVSVSPAATSITVEMIPVVGSLEEVIIVGYGTQKKIAATSAVSSVKGEELAEAPVPNITNSIGGRVTGVITRAGNGRPGDDNANIYIRGIATTGSNSPLIVVDGVIRNNINEVDPNSIADVSILKDAAAVAPYGLAGANGVILITTKRGTIGAPVLSVNSYYGDQHPTYVPKMLTAQDYMRLRSEAYLNENPGSPLPPTLFTEDYIDNYASNNATDPDKYPITDALDKVVKKHSPMYQANLQIRGGANAVKYFASVGYFDQQGLFDPVKYHRYTFNVNADINATRTTLVSISLNGSFQKTNNVDANSSTNNLYRASYKFIPIAPLYYSNGLWGEFAGNAPIGVLKAGGYYYRNTNNILSTISIEQKLPIKGLSVKAAFSYDPYNFFEKQWHKPFIYWSINTSATPYTFTQQISSQEGGAATYTWLRENYYQNNSFTYQGYLNYHNNFGKHEITGLVVAEQKNNNQLDFNARRDHFAVDLDELTLGSSDRNDYDNGGGSSKGGQIGYVYRVNYGFDRRYLVEASGRYDGHYYFAPGHKWSYFPAFSLGWVISNENFFSSVKGVDYLKLRGSWGKSGNLAGGPFQYLNAYNLYGNSYAFGSGTLVQGSYQPLEANPNITWETAVKTDIGIETSLWKNLLRVELDFFAEKRSDMLLAPSITVPVEYGLSLAQENAGIMKNHGIEVTLGSRHKLKNGLELGLDANFTYAENKLVQVFETAVTRNDPKRSRTGRALNTKFGYHSLGLFTTDDDINKDGVINSADGYDIITNWGTLHPGDIRYADLSGPNGTPDGKIDSYDETVIGRPNTPAIVYGFTATANWKGFDVSLFFQGAALSGYNINGFFTVPFFNNNSNAGYEYFDNRWTPDHQDAKYPRANQSPNTNNQQGSDFWVINTSYLRLKTLVIGYTIPSNLGSKIGFKSLRIYVTGQNLLTASKLKFTDPETNGETGYPLQRVLMFGLNASF